MSLPTGPAHDDCSVVLRDVWLFLDDELDPERRAAVQRHLDECSPCLEEAGLDSKLKRLLARKCGGEHAPAHLRERIVTGLVQWSGSIGPDGVTFSATSISATTSVTTNRDSMPSGGAGAGLPGRGPSQESDSGPDTEAGGDLGQGG